MVDSTRNADGGFSSEDCLITAGAFLGLHKKKEGGEFKMVETMTNKLTYAAREMCEKYNAHDI